MSPETPESLAARVVRDPHGNPLPRGDAAPTALGPEQVDDALVALPGWHRSGASLLRTVPVARDSREALAEGVRGVVTDDSRLRLESGEDGLTIVLGEGPGDLCAADLETAARIDTVLSGSGRDHGTTR
jgi:hypothetical protein